MSGRDARVGGQLGFRFHDVRDIVHAPDASSRQCAVLAVMPSPSFGR